MIRDPLRQDLDNSASVRAQRILGEPVMAVWDDPDVRELYVNSDGRVWADRAGTGRVATGLVLEEMAVLRFLAGIAAYRKETLTAETPALQGAMPDERFHGARIQGYIPPRAPGPGFNLRKHNPEVCPLESYLERGALGFAEYDLLLDSVDARRNVLVAGATRSGKTTFLGGLIAAISQRWPADRLLVVEDTPEIRCTSADAVLYRTLPGEPMGPVIAREAMRLSPDRIVCGEFRDRAAYYCADLWTSGHTGGAASMHAGSVEGALMRMNLLMLDGRRGSYAALVAAAVDVVVVLARGDHGGRVVDLALLDGLDRRGRFQIRRPQLGANRRDVC